MSDGPAMHRAAYTLLVAIAVGLGAPSAPAQDAPAEPERPQTLDELLGLDDPAEGESAGADGGPDRDQAELERQLTPEMMGQRLDRAVVLMDEIATRMRRAGDVGVATQRQQEDVVRLLDEVIAAAEKAQQQQQQPSPSSSSQPSRQAPQPNQPQPRPSDAQQQSDDPAQDTHMPAGAEGVRMRPGQAAAGAAWGALPERLREALTQGLSDRYSSLYERATESYYRRLAEEESR